jgi:hypothetical protein
MRRGEEAAEEKAGRDASAQGLYLGIDLFLTERGGSTADARFAEAGGHQGRRTEKRPLSSEVGISGITRRPNAGGSMRRGEEAAEEKAGRDASAQGLISASTCS